ncbi:TrmH family RNA methyltransferase [Arcanobacterium phocae]|uniref:RNA methyltransferase, TrmH family n=1 Tax=Arcanobacterium phocae TaxID=131112 RepID=A0A1H2LJA1_9ACTO|nr:RNA methyltransferase [Arcanobacterium phocae]SDU80661.1 RNA methyltransferase, TrmH family [Arcanobacterium phocae]
MPRTPMMTLSGQLKKALGLSRRKARIEYEQALVEGPQAVREALAEMPNQVRDVYVTEPALERYPDIDELLIHVDPYTHVLPCELSEQHAPNAQGIFAVISIPDEEELDVVFARSQLLVCMVEGSDPGNVGTIIRSADAAGAGGVILGSGSVDATNPKVLRSTAGSYFHLPIIEDEDVSQVVDRAKLADFQVLIADGDGEYDLATLSDQALLSSQEHNPLADIDLRRPTLWLVGNEARGFTPQQLAWADARVRIPMWGKSESLNVAMATGLCLYASAQAQNRNTAC